jgi:poly(A) RNA polymerase GLD2
LNNHIGIRNTHLLKAYSEMDWRVKPLILNIKRWAKFQGINDASQKTISSYSFALMAIFYLQSVCQPAVVPVLHKTDPNQFHTRSDITKLRMNIQARDGDNLSWTSSNKQSIGELFYGFLDYYSDFE